MDGTITYTYEALGYQVSKTVGAAATKYVYDGARVIAEYDGVGQFLRKYIYGSGLDEPVMIWSRPYYYLFYSLGSVIVALGLSAVSIPALGPVVLDIR